MYLVTISCDISLSPKQTADKYRLPNCNVPERFSGILSARKRREVGQASSEEFSRMTVSKTIDIFSRKTKETSNALSYHSLSISFFVAIIFFTWNNSLILFELCIYCVRSFWPKFDLWWLLMTLIDLEFEFLVKFWIEIYVYCVYFVLLLLFYPFKCFESKSLT